MAKLIFLRHGETDTGSNADLIESRSTTWLNVTGRGQARASAKEIAAAHEVSAIYSSPLNRARETALILYGATGARFHVCDELVERSFGSLEGQSWASVIAVHGQDIKDRDSNQTYNYVPWGGESVREVKARLERFIAELVKNHAGQTVACVTHGGVMRLLGFDVPWRASAEYRIIEL